MEKQLYNIAACNNIEFMWLCGGQIFPIQGHINSDIDVLYLSQDQNQILTKQPPFDFFNINWDMPLNIPTLTTFPYIQKEHLYIPDTEKRAYFIPRFLEFVAQHKDLAVNAYLNANRTDVIRLLEGKLSRHWVQKRDYRLFLMGREKKDFDLHLIHKIKMYRKDGQLSSEEKEQIFEYLLWLSQEIDWIRDNVPVKQEYLKMNQELSLLLYDTFKR